MLPDQRGANAERRSAYAERSIGHYLVAPLVKALDNGWFASSVSIRTGATSESHDGATHRVLRLTRLFRCAKQAAGYAHAEALQWISATPSPSAA